MKMFLCMLVACVGGHVPLRGYSVVWRNANDQMIKQVVYNRRAVFTPRFANELKELNKFPNGFVYDLHVMETDRMNKILVRRRRNISSTD